MNRELILTRAAAGRIVGYEFRQQVRGTQYSNTEDFALMVMSWMATTSKKASQYVALTSESKIIDGSIPEDEAIEERIDLLTNIVMSGDV